MAAKDRGFRVIMDKCIVQSTPFKNVCDTGPYITFYVRREEITYKIFCFDDERKNSPYKMLLKLFEKGSIKKGSVLSLDCIETHITKSAISDEMWSKLSQENLCDKVWRELVKQDNPTSIMISQYKLVSWDFAIPLEYHKTEKEKVATSSSPPKPCKPIMDMSRFGGDKG